MRVTGQLQRSSLLLAALSLLIDSVVLTQPAMADRPGTPNEVGLRNCPFSPMGKPRLCGNFTNTASEEVTFEAQVNKNGALVSQKIDCFNLSVEGGKCWWPSQKYIRNKLDIETHRPLQFQMPELEFNTKYCFRVRARRASDQMVSELWSAGVCATTPGPPAAPTPPVFSVKFDGRQPVPNKPPIPESMTVSYEKYDGAGALTTNVMQANGPDSYDRNKPRVFNREHGVSPASAFGNFNNTPDKIAISPDATWLYVEVCTRNLSGQACSHKVVSAAVESVVEAPPGGKPIKITGAARDPSLQPNTDLPGSDYRKQELSSNDPQQCQQLCNSEANCKAWTFVAGGVQSARAMCWLKNDIPRAAYNKNMVSGVKAGAKSDRQAGPPIQYKVEFPGSEYRQAPTAIFFDCKALCNRESQCKAWTWYPRGLKGTTAVCSLKNAVPAAVANEKTASGLKDDAPPATPNAAAR